MRTTGPIISFIIATYNSAAFILETLESAKHQTYGPIELIIADDHSTDQTIEICENWIENNRERFVRTVIVTNAVNTGTSANLNRGMMASTGQWIKFIAGDDYLYPQCFETFMDEIDANPRIQFLFCNIAVNGTPADTNELASFFNLNREDQYIALLKKSMLPAPAAFIDRRVIEQVNGFDERFKLLEDYPFFLHVLNTGIRFYFINQPLVYYRVHETNISWQQKLNINYLKDVKQFFKLYYLKEIFKNQLYLHYTHYILQYVLLQLATKGYITQLKTYNSILSWCSLLNWKLRIQKRLSL